MRDNENIFDGLHLVRYCSYGTLVNDLPGAKSFQINRKKESDLSFVCLEMVCNDAWETLNDRPKAVVELEEPYPLETKKSDLWAVSLESTILNSIYEAVLEATRKLNVEYSDIFPTVFPDPIPEVEAKVGVKWDAQSIPIPEAALDLAIANRLAASVEQVFPAKENKKRRERRQRKSPR